MYKSRFFVVAFVVAAMGVFVWAACYLGTVGIPANADESQTTADDCDGCQALKTVVSDDPQERQTQFERFEQMQNAQTAQIVNEARKAALQWKGCKFVPSASDSDEYAKQKDVAVLLSGNATVPEGRNAFFGSYLSHEGMRHVGWEGTIAHVANAQDVAIVEVHVRPSLVTDNGLAAFVPRWMRETWRIDKAGNATFDKAEPGDGMGGIIVD